MDTTYALPATDGNLTDIGEMLARNLSPADLRDLGRTLTDLADIFGEG